MLIAKPDGTLATFLDISSKVDSTGERGLQAVTLDPKHSPTTATSTTPKRRRPTPVHDGIVRFTARVTRSSRAARSSSSGSTTRTPSSTWAGVEFGNDEKLYVATADNFAPTNSQQLTNLFGKMLRITESSSIPTDNPALRTTSGKNRAIWALGLRNPYKFAIQPGAAPSS